MYHGKKDLEKKEEGEKGLCLRFAGLVEHSNFPSKEWVLLRAPPKTLSL